MRKNKVASSIWHLVLQPNTDTKELFKKKNIGPHIVKYEFMRKPALTQCKKCQRFFHAASQCYMPYRCVKCTDKHNPGNSTSPTTTKKPKCVNCNGDHTANDAKQCSAFQRAIKVSEERKEKNAKPNQHNKKNLHRTWTNEVNNSRPTHRLSTQPNSNVAQQTYRNQISAHILNSNKE